MQHRQKFSFVSFFEKLVQNRKSVSAYAGSFLLMTAVFGMLNLMRTNSNDLLKLIQLIGFFGMGCLNLFALQNESGSFLSRKYFFEQLLYTLLITGVICLFLSLVYLLTSSDILVAFRSSCAFVVPFLLAQAWFFYKHIPKNSGLVWMYSEVPTDELALSFRNKVPVRFQFSRKYFEMKEVEFPVTVSSWIKLGSLFHELLLEQNKNEAASLELVDENGNPYGWEFFEERLNGFSSRQLDPKLNVRENKVAQYSVIVARRVQVIASEKPGMIQLA